MNRGIVAAVVGSAALLVVGGGTAALAAGGAGHASSQDRQARCEARLAKIAAHRGITVDQLEASIKAKISARIDAALTAGKINSDRAAKLKARVASFEFCSGHGVRPLVRMHERGAMLKAAAGFLGLDRAGLRAQLPGTSLTALAQGQGKSQADLESAMLAPANARLAKAVSAGHLKQPRADRILARLAKHAHVLATKTFPAK